MALKGVYASFEEFEIFTLDGKLEYLHGKLKACIQSFCYLDSLLFFLSALSNDKTKEIYIKWGFLYFLSMIVHVCAISN